MEHQLFDVLENKPRDRFIWIYAMKKKLNFCYLLILEGTFSDDIITTGMFLNDDDSWNSRKNPIKFCKCLVSGGISVEQNFSNILKQFLHPNQIQSLFTKNRSFLKTQSFDDLLNLICFGWKTEKHSQQKYSKSNGKTSLNSQFFCCIHSNLVIICL